MFLVSTPEMVIEAGKQDAIGSFPLLNARPAEKCATWMEQIKAELGEKKWAVNFICHRGSNKRYEEDFELIRTHQPPIVITSLGNPSPVVEVVHEYGGEVYSDVATLKHAEKAASTGVDGLILVCAGAGGHGGTLNPFSFTGAVKQFYDGKIILSGGMSTGRDVAAAKLMGADYAYLGTRFIASEESSAPKEYKQMLAEVTVEDVLYTNALSGVHANLLIPSLERNGIDPNGLKVREDVDLSHLVDVKAWRDIWSAGHGVTLVKKTETVREIIQQLRQEYKGAMSSVESNTFY